MGDWRKAATTTLRQRLPEGALPTPKRSGWNRYGRSRRFIWFRFWPISDAHLGNFTCAHELIEVRLWIAISALRVRGNVAMLEKTGAPRSNGIARAAALAPSIPFAYAEWGRMLVAKGDLDGAIAKFDPAHQKGPHFADPLEMWGEALIAKNRSDLALAKFEEADEIRAELGTPASEMG